MNISALFEDYHDKSGEQQNKINTFVANSLIHIIEHYFAQWSSFFVWTLCCRNNHTCNFYNDMFRKMFAQWQEWPLQIVNVNSNEHKTVPGAKQYNMIFTDSYNAFLESEIYTYGSNMDTNEYYFIFLQTRDQLQAGEMQKIFEYCWHYYLVNCVVAMQTRNGRVLLYTYYPFTAEYCGQVEGVLINEYNGTSLVNEELFPNKLRNFYGCPLKAALRHIPPFLYLNTDTNNITTITGGFEGKLLLTLSDKLNFSLDIILPPNDSRRGIFMATGSLTGAVKMLHDHDIHLSLGALRHNRKRNSVATPTLNYFETNWIVVTLNNGFILNSWETLLFPYSDVTWCILVLSIMSASLIAILLRHLICGTKTKNQDHITLDVLLTFLGMPALYAPKYNASRILNVTWITFSFILRTIYQSLLYHLIRNHIVRNMPRSLEELVAQNYTLILDVPSMNSMSAVALFESTNFVILNSTIDVMPLMYLEDLPPTRAKRMAAVIAQVFLHHYVQDVKNVHALQVLPYTVISLRICMYLTKHSYLLQQFDDTLKNMRSHGLLNAWLRQEVDVDYFKSAYSPPYHILDLSKLEMAFKLLILGYTVATLVFVLELMLTRFHYRICYRKLLIVWNHFLWILNIKKNA